MASNKVNKPAQLYDATEFLKTDEDAAPYLNAALEDGDPALVSATRSDIARAQHRYHSPNGNPAINSGERNRPCSDA